MSMLLLLSLPVYLAYKMCRFVHYAHTRRRWLYARQYGLVTAKASRGSSQRRTAVRQGQALHDVVEDQFRESALDPSPDWEEDE